jgi:hypothetical protein
VLNSISCHFNKYALTEADEKLFFEPVQEVSDELTDHLYEDFAPIRVKDKKILEENLGNPELFVKDILRPAKLNEELKVKKKVMCLCLTDEAKLKIFGTDEKF